MLKWLLDNPWVVVVIAGLVAQILKAARGVQGRTGPEASPPASEDFEETEAEERTRRIREEIRRRIAERHAPAGSPRPAAPEPAAAPPEVAPPPVLTLPDLIREVMAPAEPAVAEPAPETGVARSEELERQAALAEQLEMALSQKQSADRRVAFEATLADPEPAARQMIQQGVRADLHDPAALRRAWVLREVLGPPVALR